MIKGKIQKPDFVAAQQSITNILRIDNQLKAILDEEIGQQTAVKNIIKSMHDAKVRHTLENLDIEQINKDKQGIRVSALREVGIHNIWRVHNMSIQQIYNIRGIGKQSAYKIKEVADLIAHSVNESTYVRISHDQRSDADNKLIQALYILVNTKDLRSACHMLYNTNHSSILTNVAQAKRFQSSLSWFFSSRTKKETAFENLVKINDLLSDEYGNQSYRLYKEYQQITTASFSVCWADFEYRSSTYYAQIEKIDCNWVKNEVIQNGIPEQLASQVENYPLKLNLMKSTLRRYQEFGAKYILRQRNVLLGDEMGLGKTVQAIAAISSLKEDGKTHFMVVCPAGVLVNWYREIGMHSELNAIKIHGENCIALKEWLDNGGIAVTTYESISKISLPNEFKINVLVADEAHYVKNPNANRTRALLSLLKIADRSLFMTGTPLENKVDEMCFLVNCLQSEVAIQLESIKYLSTAPQFREKLAPVYLRRTRVDVLKELPDLIENEVWCNLTKPEKQAYYDSVMSGNFMAMRQVSWQVGNLSLSSKALRLQEICVQAQDEGRKIIVFSFFRDTISKVFQMLESRCLEPITGSVSPTKRQEIIDTFTKSVPGTVLVSQVQAGGTGLNIQAASVVVFCEPQIKPSIENQAISRAYRMGQIRNVLIYRLLCEECIDERIIEILRHKQDVFDNFANESVIGTENMKMSEQTWVSQMVQFEKDRLLIKS